MFDDYWTALLDPALLDLFGLIFFITSRSLMALVFLSVNVLGLLFV